MAVQTPSTAARSRTAARKRWWIIVLQVLLVLAVIAGFALLHRIRNLPDYADDQQTIIVGPNRFAPDSDVALRVIVQDLAQGRPIPDAQVKVKLKPDSGRTLTLFEGQTDEFGSLPVQFHVPADAPTQASLIVETRSDAGRDTVEQPVTIQRDYRLLLSSDKPLYQPGQVIHMRALALSILDLSPARGATVDFLVQDPKGNKVFRQSVPASDFGVAAADFTLADMVIQGNYKLSVSIGDTTSEKTVEVRPYVLPKFALALSTERSYYLPGEHVEGALQADYFFGKPVGEAQVQIVGTVWDVERTVVLDLQGQTDENGTYPFSFDLPTYFAGSGLESGQAQFALEVTVIDQTDHAEQTSQVLPIAAQPLVIEAVAESGALKPGVENVVYVLISYPDGRPARAQLQVSVDGAAYPSLDSSEFGLAEFTFTPQQAQNHVIDISARDEAGRSADCQIVLQSEAERNNVLLRADRAAYLVGETMQLVALTPVESGSIYLDIVKAGQALSTRSARVEGGRAEFAIDVSPDMYGTLELHAYKVLLDGTIVRDTRMVVVDAPTDLTIDISADRDTYLPGDLAKIVFQTWAAENPDQGVQTALGLAIVDESVFALQQQDPGFAKLYFLLEQELLEPFYQIKGFELPAVIPPDQEPVREAQDVAAKATWAGVHTSAAHSINSRTEKMSVLYQSQQDGLKHMGNVEAFGLILVPLAMLGAVIPSLRRAKKLWPSLKRLGVALLIILLVGLPWVNIFYNGSVGLELLSVTLLLPFGLGLLVLAGYAWVKKDPAAQFVFLLTLAWVAILVLLVQTTDQGASPADNLFKYALLASMLIPIAYILFGQGRWVQGRRLPGWLGSGLGAIAALPVLLLVTSSLSFSPMGMRNMNGIGLPQADGDMVVLEMAAGAPPPESTPAAAPLEKGQSSNEGQSTGEPPRLRQYFPETLYWNPDVRTDENGYLALDIPMADSITTWRLTALASSQDGRLGFATHSIRVFQDFFVDVDLPVALTQGDEISIPVGVFNYLPREQQVRLVVEAEPWFELLGPAEQTLTIASNDIEVVYFPIRVAQFGWQGFQVTAWGEQMSDAIRRSVRVLPDGQEVRLSESDWLRESKTVAVEIPAESVPGTAYLEVKVYPGVMAQVVEGLEKILRLPHG